jgi:predicted dithiol-disulfide oxidoreductase (DUF899 family)
MAAATGTDVASYVSEGPGFSAFVLADGVVYHTYSTHARGLECLMGYYPILGPGAEGTRRGRFVRVLDPPARRVRPGRGAMT